MRKVWTLLLAGGILAAGSDASCAQVFANTCEEWRQQVFDPGALEDIAISGPEADPDGDGWSNWIEYAFDGNPHQPEPALQPLEITWRDDWAVLVLYRWSTDDLVYALEGTPDLNQPWSLRNPRYAREFVEHGFLERGWFPDVIRADDYKSYFWRLRVFTPREDDFALRPPEHLKASPLLGAFRQPDGLLAFFGNRLDWVDRSLVEGGFRIYRRAAPGDPWQLVGEAGRDETLFRDFQTDSSVAYEYRLGTFQGPGEEETFSSAITAPPTAPDADGDGIPDALELGAAYRGAPGTFPTSPATAHSGPYPAPDGWWARHGLNAFCSPEKDTDGDGRPDWIEYLHGTNPLKAEERVAASLRPASGLSLETGPDGFHTLRWNPDASGSWTIVERSADGRNWTIAAVLPSSVLTFKDVAAGPNALRFYRLVALD